MQGIVTVEGSDRTFVVSEWDLDNILSEYPEWVSDKVSYRPAYGEDLFDGDACGLDDLLSMMVEEQRFLNLVATGDIHMLPEEEIAEMACKFPQIWKEREHIYLHFQHMMSDSYEERQSYEEMMDDELPF